MHHISGNDTERGHISAAGNDVGSVRSSSSSSSYHTVTEEEEQQQQEGTNGSYSSMGESYYYHHHHHHNDSNNQQLNYHTAQSGIHYHHHQEDYYGNNGHSSSSSISSFNYDNYSSASSYDYSSSSSSSHHHHYQHQQQQHHNETPTQKNYQILGFLGKGSYGRVYSARKLHQPRKNHLVAIKRISCDSFSDASNSLQEILKISSLCPRNHHLLNYYKCWLEEDVTLGRHHRGLPSSAEGFYVVLEMELCDMGTLEAFVKHVICDQRDSDALSTANDSCTTANSTVLSSSLEEDSNGSSSAHEEDSRIHNNGVSTSAQNNPAAANSPNTPSSSHATQQNTCPKISQSLIVEFLLQISDALREMHELKIVHRDIKMENILLKSLSNSPESSQYLNSSAPLDYSEKFHFKLADFGFAKNLNYSIANSVAGSINYMAPEVLNSSQNASYDTSVDIWSFGCVLTELLTLKRNQMFLYKLLEDRDGFLSTLKKTLKERGYDPLFYDIISSCLSVDPKARMTASQIYNHAQFMKEQQDFFQSVRTLPNDVFFDVASFLPLQDLLSLGTVDRNFRQIANSERIWEHQYKSSFFLPPSWTKTMPTNNEAFRLNTSYPSTMLSLDDYSFLIRRRFSTWKDLFIFRKQIEKKLLDEKAKLTLVQQLEHAAHETRVKQAKICVTYGRELLLAANKYTSEPNKDIITAHGGHVFSLDSFSIALERNPKSVIAWRNMGLAYMTLEREEEALTCFRAALDISPDDPQLLFSYASFYARFLLDHAPKEVQTVPQVLELEQQFMDADEHFSKSLRKCHSVTFLLERSKNLAHFANFLFQFINSFLCCSEQDTPPLEILELFVKALHYFQRSTHCFNQCLSSIPREKTHLMELCNHHLADNALCAQNLVHTLSQNAAVDEDDLQQAFSKHGGETVDVHRCSLSDLYRKYFQELTEVLKVETTQDPSKIPVEKYELYCQGVIIEMTRTFPSDVARCKRICLRSIEILAPLVEKLSVSSGDDTKSSGGGPTLQFLVSTLGITYLKLISILMHNQEDTETEVQEYDQEELALYLKEAVHFLSLTSEEHVKYYNLACLYSIVRNYELSKENLEAALQCAPTDYFKASDMMNDDDLRNLRTQEAEWFEGVCGK